MVPRRDYRLMLNVPAIFGFFVVSLAGLLDLDNTQRLWAAPFLIVFGVLFLLADLKRMRPALAHVCVAIMTACVCGLITFQPGWGVFPILFYLLDPLVMIQFPLRAGLVWNAIFAVSIGVLFLMIGGVSAIVAWLVYSAGFIFFGVFGYVVSQSERDRKQSQQLLAELQETHKQLQAYAGQLKELTIAQERNRIAREMHDTLGHRLTIAAVQLEGAQRLVRKDPERAETMIGTVRDQVREGLSELRRTVAMLRASPDEDMPIALALEKLVQQTTEATGLRIHLSLDDSPPNLPAPYRQALYRAAQEGLTNIQRHAQAAEAWIQLVYREEHLTLLVGDNGVGIEMEKERAGFGLNGLRERAALLGGDCYIDKRPGGGVQLSFRLPLPEKRPEYG